MLVATLAYLRTLLPLFKKKSELLLENLSFKCKPLVKMQADLLLLVNIDFMFVNFPRLL